MPNPIDQLTAREVRQKLADVFIYAYTSEIVPILEKDKQALIAARLLLSAFSTSEDLKQIIDGK